jgi:hypothetical protein
MDADCLCSLAPYRLYSVSNEIKLKIDKIRKEKFHYITYLKALYTNM